MASKEHDDHGQDDGSAAAVSAEDMGESLGSSVHSLSAADFLEAMSMSDDSQQVNDITMQVPTLLHSFDAKLREESSSPLLYDITMSQSGQHAIVTDCWNRCVKAFDLTLAGCPCTSVFQMKEECPLCITNLSQPERVVITLHQRQELYVLDIQEKDGSKKTQDIQETQDIQKISDTQKTTDIRDTNETQKTDDMQKVQDLQNTQIPAAKTKDSKSREQERPTEVLSFHSVISTSCYYRGISTLYGGTHGESPERLVLTVPKEIHVVSLEGDILQVIAPTFCGLPLLVDVIYITTTPCQDLVVTDVGARRVLCLKFSGRLHWFHPSLQAPEEEGGSNVLEDLKVPEEGQTADESSAEIFKGVHWPLGVAADREGRVFVCDLELHSVVLLSSGGAAGRLLLTQNQALQFPRGLSINNNCLCITQDDCIKIFSMS